MSDENPAHPVVGGRYELGEVLGRGGMAEVRKGTDRRLGRVVAVKRLRTDLAGDQTFQARFRREAQSAASLNHPAIAAVYDTGEEMSRDGTQVSQPYIVMEYVAGRTLRDIVREGRKILPERALEITSGVLSALDYSHRAGIVHRDIKPANVMLTPSGDVKVMDFGIARAMADASSNMTQTAAVVGTAQYLSPEQARGETVDSRSDVYSTGCLLYELLTGRPPFVGDSPVAVAYQHVREQAPPPSSLDPDLVPEIDAIVMKALTKRVEDRYQSASAMRADIERFLAGKPVVAPVVPVADPDGMVPDDATSIFTPAAAGAAAAGSHLPDENRRNNKVPLIVAGLGILVLLILALIFGPQLFKSAPQQTSVPSVIGLTKAQAVNRLQDAGFSLGTVDQAASPDVDKGKVMKQDPEGKSLADPHTTVDLTISTGKPDVTVPFVIGDNKEVARQKLEDAGLKVDMVKKASDQPQDTVLSTDPNAATSVTSGSVVKVFYSAGPKQVPSVVGMQQGEAESVLRKAGFNVNVVEDSTTPAQKGQVLKQSPEAYTTQPQGTTVTITVSSYETPSATPSPTPTESTSPIVPPPSNSATP